MDKRMVATIVTTVACLIVAIICQYVFLPNEPMNAGLGWLMTASWVLITVGTILVGIRVAKIYRRRK